MPDRASITSRPATPPAPGRAGAPALTARRPGPGQPFLPGIADLPASFQQPDRPAVRTTCAACGPAVSCPPPAEAVSLTLPGTLDQVRQARNLIVGVLAGCPRADDVILAVSELAANAIRFFLLSSCVAIVV